MRFMWTANHGALLLVLLAGCDWPGKPKDTDRPIPAEKVADFDALYSTHCAGCHGADGTFGPAPPLNDPIFLAIVPQGVLQDVIAEGRPGTPMTAFAKDKGGPLTDKQVDILAQGIKPRWMAGAKAEDSLPGYHLAVAVRGNEEIGRKVFARACAECHGPEGQGGGAAGAVNDPAFLALVSDQALRRYILTGRPDFGMPNYAERDDVDFKPLTSQEINDLVALLSSWRASGSVNARDGR